MSSHRSFFPDEGVLIAHGAKQLAEGLAAPGSCGVEVQGWLVVTRCRPLCNETELSELVQKLTPVSVPEAVSSHPSESILVRGNHLQLPEMLFGGNALQLRSPSSGLAVHFCAEHALRAWVDMHVDGGPVEVIKVPASRYWQAKAEASGFKQEEYDWTWNGPYRGNTFKVDQTDAPPGTVIPCDDGGNASGPLAWRECEESGADAALLRDAAAPILFFDEVTLFEDFIHDAGEARLSAKVRVMPACWYVLLRYWLRVDGVALKIADARYFHRFGASDIYRDVSVLSMPYAEVERRLPPNTQACRLTADEAYPLLQQAGTSTVKHEVLSIQ